MGAIAHEQLSFSILSPSLTIEAMRDSGYKDTDHALAELIDNSIEANANLVELIAIETPPAEDIRYARNEVSEIAVADNGEGMTKDILRRALKFGDGTRLDRPRRGMGRFGIGLPNASISQCRRVDIWTWQNGASNALHCFLDLDDVAKGMTDVPEPQHTPVPDHWKRLAKSTWEPSGTLVIWSNLDKVRWKGGRKTLERTEELCGRIYRKFLTGTNPVQIQLTLATDNGDGSQLTGQPDICRPNDPTYLLAPSSTPAPFDDRPMFEKFNERTWTIPVGDEEGEVHVTCALASTDAINEKKGSIVWPRSYSKAGDAPWGKHAERNKGVSLVRAKREIELSHAWVNNYEPQERWWSVEVEFDPILDEIFGVVNNKQHAHAFLVGAGFDTNDAKDNDETIGEFQERLHETGDLRAHLIEIWNWIDNQIIRMREERKRRMKGTGSKGGRHSDTGSAVEDIATTILNEQAEDGITGVSDTNPKATPKEKIEKITESAKQRRVEESTARQWAEETVQSGRRVLLKEVNLGHRDAFFDIDTVNDIIEIWINDNHPVYTHLVEVIDADTEGQSQQELSDRLDKAAFTLKMLISAWARYEDKAPAGMKDTIRDCRMDWGREARKFFEVMDS